MAEDPAELSRDESLRGGLLYPGDAINSWLPLLGQHDGIIVEMCSLRTPKQLHDSGN